MALGDPAAELRGVVTTVGNNDVGLAIRLLYDLLGTNVPVYEGADECAACGFNSLRS